MTLSVTIHDDTDQFVARIAKRTTANTHGNLGTLYRRKEDYRAAVDAHRHGLSLSSDIGDLHGVANSWFNLSLALQQTGVLGEARRAAQTALEHYQALKMPDMIAKAEAQLAHLKTLR